MIYNITGAIEIYGNYIRHASELILIEKGINFKVSKHALVDVISETFTYNF